MPGFVGWWRCAQALYTRTLAVGEAWHDGGAMAGSEAATNPPT